MIARPLARRRGVLAVLATRAAGAAAGARPIVARIVIDGTINPAVAELRRSEAIAAPQPSGAAALLIELDTPGRSAHVDAHDREGHPGARRCR